MSSWEVVFSPFVLLSIDAGFTSKTLLLPHTWHFLGSTTSEEMSVLCALVRLSLPATNELGHRT